MYSERHAVAGDGEQGQGGAAQELDAFDGEVGAALRSLEAAVADERVFLRPSAGVSALARAAAKALFDHTGAASATAAGELYVDGFDAEQIWGQLELQVGRNLLRSICCEPYPRTHAAQMLMPE